MSNEFEFYDKDAIQFTGFGTGARIGKSDIMGEQLWRKLFERDPKFGGVTCAFYGVPGSGKTSLMLQICRQIAHTYPDEVIYWREPWGVPCQIFNLGMPVNILSDNSSNVVIKELTETGAVNTKEHPVRHFKRPSSLLKMVKPGINMVYFKERTGWLDLIRSMKGNLSWQSFFLDEAEDIFPSRAGGKDWYLNEEFCQDFKELRKARISLYANSQTDWDFDPRVKSKLMLECYLYGSKKNKDSPLYRGVLQDIALGEGWITYAHSLFGKIRFSPIEPLSRQYIAVLRGKE